MDQFPPPKRRPVKKRRRFWGGLLSLFIFASTAGMLTLYWVVVFYPNSERIEPDFGGLQKPIFYRGTLLETEGSGSKDSLKLPISFLKDKVDPNIYYEEATDSIILTTKDRVIRMKTDQLTAVVNEQPITLQFPAVKQGAEIYLPVDPVKQLYGLEIRESDETGAVIVHLQGETVQWGKAAEAEEAVLMRTEPTIKAPIVADLSPGEQVMIWSDTDEWYRVQRQNGTMGYAKKKEIRLDRVETVPLSAEPPPFVPWKPLGGKINMTWEHVVTRNPDPSKIGPMPGLNVISPTWFSIIDGEGNLKNLADASYVKWAHSRGYQVWALFSNGFDADVTTAALATYDKRMKMIRQLLAYAQMYQLDGINIDFEYVYLKDKDRLTQFVREMTPMFHEQGLVVSIDVTFKSTSEMWSMFYDRKALAEVVDYMMVMAYDEHPAASPVSGSVSSLPWVEKGIVRILQEDQVPPSKLVLGIPYYTRIWTEQTVNGKKEVSSRAVFMETAQKQLSERGVKPQYDPATGQNYAEYTEGGKRIRVWLEDETSLAARLEIVKKYDLAGIASWRRGYETPNIWEFIENHMNKRP